MGRPENGVKLDGYVTVADVVDKDGNIVREGLQSKLGVSKQRAHQLCATYGVKKRMVGNRAWVRRADLAKIPRERPSGVNRQ